MRIYNYDSSSLVFTDKAVAESESPSFTLEPCCIAVNKVPGFRAVHRPQQYEHLALSLGKHHLSGCTTSWLQVFRQQSRSPFTSSQIQLHLRRSYTSEAKSTKQPPASSTASVADLPLYKTPRKGFLSLLPSSWVPLGELMRLDKPTGLYLFYFPYLFGLLYAACVSQPIISPYSLAATSATFLVGTIIMRGAACTWNDNVLDRQVTRCCLRPIARGAVSSAKGHIFTIAQSVVGRVGYAEGLEKE